MVASRQRRRLRIASAAVVVAASSVLTGCELPSFGFPDGVSEQADEVAGLWSGSMATGLAVGAVVWGLIFWALIRFRRRSDDVPSQVHEHIPIEILYTVVPIVIVATLFFFTVRTDQAIDTGRNGPPDVTVEVIGFQWQWEFRYPAEGVTVTGASDGDPPELVLPVQRRIRFDLNAQDVNHSFWVPRFLTKRDLIGGVENQIDVDTTTVGTYAGRCAEFCGLDHWRMNFTVRVVPEPEYRAWINDRLER